jgi:glycosyltransferase involved in cell wall biosynthesis
MSEIPTISIVTPSYNQGDFLAETIESVIGQEGDFRIDYIIVDGDSTDDSLEIIRRYEMELNNGEWPLKCHGISYRWLSEKDKGQADALMKGFRLSRGEILAWLCSDDTYFPGTLAMVKNVFADTPGADVVYGKSRFNDEEGMIIGYYPTEPFDYRRLAVANFISQPAAFFTKASLFAIGGLDTNLRYAMDFDLWIRLANERVFHYLPEFLSTYRLHGKSKTMSPDDALANHRECLETVRRHYGWAPLNRVYGYCSTRLTGLLPCFMTRSKILNLLPAVPYTIILYLLYNRGVKFEDLKMINGINLNKLSKNWFDASAKQ